MATAHPPAGAAPIGDASSEAPPAAVPVWASSRTAWFTISMIGVVTVFGQMDRAIFYLLVSAIKRDLQFSDTQMSLLMGAAYSGAYFLCGLPIARLTDVWQRRIILPSALAAWSAGTALCALSSGFVSLFLARSIVGAGESVKGPCSVSMISDLFPRDKLPRAFAFYNLAIRGGEALALIIGGLLIGWLAHKTLDLPGVGTMRDWHLVFLIFGIPGVLFALTFLTLVKEPARHGRTTKGSVPIRDVLHFLFKSPARGVLLPILLSAAVGSIEMVGIGSWRPVFYERTYGWGPADFAPILGVSSLIITPIGLAAGAFLAERFARQGYDDANMRIVLWVQFASLPLAIVSPLMPSFELALACSLLASLLATMSAPAQLAAMQVVTPNELRGQVNALYMFTVAVLGQGLGPTVVALMTDYLFQSEASLRYAMVTMSAISGPITLVLAWVSLKPYGRAYRASTAA